MYIKNLVHSNLSHIALRTKLKNTPPDFSDEVFLFCHSDNKYFAYKSSVNYLSVTLAPSASIFVLMSSASSLEAPSLRTLGAPSTTSLASLSPKPVTSRTTLITLTLFGPTSVSSTSNSSFSAAPSAPAAPWRPYWPVRRYRRRNKRYR